MARWFLMAPVVLVGCVTTETGEKVIDPAVGDAVQTGVQAVSDGISADPTWIGIGSAVIGGIVAGVGVYLKKRKK